MQLNGSVSGLRALRALRALRPLRTLSRVPSLRLIANGLVEAVPMLLSVMSIVLFYGVVFAIAGLNLFKESLHRRCLIDSGNDEGLPEWARALPITYPSESLLYGCGDSLGARRCFDASAVCAGGDAVEAGGYETLPEGWPSFDNFLTSLLSVFVVTTLSQWNVMMYRCADCTSSVSSIYFVLLVITGPLFLVNLFLAVRAPRPVLFRCIPTTRSGRVRRKGRASRRVVIYT